ncbi:helix-turn-helix transcriptional regulator [Robertkochia flava]|uniref:helix-turn-helix transcriptional regulator n=1 Tax=Robertkochia flava TaxID=3447986 RepID=UPI001CCD2B62|nr:helix-turn-helix transcriptional regulator [Robertkochia marina]
MNSETSSSKEHPYVKKLREIVLENIENEDFDVESFAALAGGSRSDLYRKIKKHTGKSVTEFVRDIRLRTSLKYLGDGTHTVAEVSYKVGFSSPTYFNKCFKDKFGFTPGDAEHYRDKIDAILKTIPEEIGNTENKSSWKKGVSLLAILIGLISISWFFLIRSQPQDSENDSKKTEGLSLIHTKKNKGLSIAALPILNYTGIPENDVISYYATFEIISSLNGIDSITKVPPLRLVGKYKDSLDISAKELTERIGVDYILQGYLNGNNSEGYQLMFELFDAQETLIWNHMFKYKTEEADQTYREFNHTAFLLAKELGVNTPEVADPTNKTENPIAMDYYSKGLYEANSYTSEGWQKALALINKALEKDPEFVDAYSELAELWLYGGMNWAYTSQEEGWNNAKALYNKVLQIDPDNDDAKDGLANGIFYYELNVQDTVPEHFGIPYETWIRTHPDHAEKTGQHKNALESNLNWQQRDPINAIVSAMIALNYYFLDRPAEAVQKLDESYPRHKDDLNYLREASKAYYFLGEYEKMEEVVMHFYNSFEHEDISPIFRWLRAIVADLNNNRAEVDKQLQVLLESYQNSEAGSPAWFIALYHAYRKDADKTLEWLEKSYAAREMEMTWLAQEPDLELVGDHPRYIALLDSMNFPQSARAHVKNTMNPDF